MLSSCSSDSSRDDRTRGSAFFRAFFVVLSCSRSTFSKHNSQAGRYIKLSVKTVCGKQLDRYYLSSYNRGRDPKISLLCRLSVASSAVAPRLSVCTDDGGFVDVVCAAGAIKVGLVESRGCTEPRISSVEVTDLEVVAISGPSKTFVEGGFG